MNVPGEKALAGGRLRYDNAVAAWESWDRFRSHDGPHADAIITHGQSAFPQEHRKRLLFFRLVSNIGK